MTAIDKKYNYIQDNSQIHPELTKHNRAAPKIHKYSSMSPQTKPAGQMTRLSDNNYYKMCQRKLVP